LGRAWRTDRDVGRGRILGVGRCGGRLWGRRAVERVRKRVTGFGSDACLVGVARGDALLGGCLVSEGGGTIVVRRYGG